MRKRFFLLMTCVFLTLFFLSCPQPSPPIDEQTGDTAKFQIHPSAIRGDYPTRVAVYIDAERYTPLNALYYVLEDGTPFFDHVILGSLQLRRGIGGVSFYIPPGLAGLLQRHSTHIRPLREAGMKVLLGVRGGHDGMTFSTIPNEYLDAAVETLVGMMRAHSLDGFEIWDIDGADVAGEWEVDGSGFPYPSGTHRLADGTYHTIEFGGDPDDEHDCCCLHWGGFILGDGGGLTLSNFILFLRSQLVGGPGGGDIVGGDLERYIILAREENYGAWINNDPPAGSFTMIFEHLNFSVNPNPANFGSSGGWSLNRFMYGGGADYWMSGGSDLMQISDNRQFGPLAIELHPANSRLNSPGLPPTAVVPPIADENGNCILNFTIKFFEGDFFENISRASQDATVARYGQFGIIHYRGLRPTSLAGSDGTFLITDAQYEDLIARMTEKRDALQQRFPGNEDFDFDIVVERTPDGQRLTQAGYMSITSLFVFGQPVILLNGGGNHIKNW